MHWSRWARSALSEAERTGIVAVMSGKWRTSSLREQISVRRGAPEESRPQIQKDPVPKFQCTCWPLETIVALILGEGLPRGDNDDRLPAAADDRWADRLRRGGPPRTSAPR